jgi:RNA polymerase sigma factor (sigma-70 family)
MADSGRNSGNASQPDQSNASVTEWLNRVRDESNSEAFALIFERYMAQVVRQATSHLSRNLRRIVDGDDIANEVFVELHRGLREDRFRNLHDRKDLWQVLLMLAERQARGRWRAEQAQKRGGGAVQAAADLAAADDLEQPFSYVAGREPSPADAAEVSDLLQVCLNDLPPDFRSIVMDWLSGYTLTEIVQRQRKPTTLSTVERRIAVFRNSLEKLKSE